jgi:hypothetical protein
VLAGAEAITDIAMFGEKKLDVLRRFRPFAHGTPSMTRSARSSPPWMRSNVNGVLSLGLHP